MNTFDIAWSLLKEEDTMIYDSRFRELSDLFRDRPVVNRQSMLPSDDLSFMPVHSLPPRTIDTKFAHGLAQRMDTSPSKTPTRVVRYPEGNWGDEYVLEDDDKNEYSRLSGMIKIEK